MVQDIEGIYRNLTSVDIESQKRLWDERGKGYYGEYLVFERLYQNVSGNCKLLMNLQIPVDASHKTEIDLLMIHERGLFVFEVKHYKGTIYGKYTDPTWTQYFRTQENSAFNSPVRQNQYHIQALQRLFPNVPIFSFIVFTNEEVELKVTGWENTDTTVCRLDSIAPYLNQKAGATTFQMSMEQINAVFRQLEPYSPISSAAVPYDGAVLPFDQYTEHIRKDFQAAVAENKNAYDAALQSEKNKYTKKKRTAGITGAAVAVLAIVLAGIVMLGALTKKGTAEKEAEQAVSIAKEAQKKAESELAEFQKNFKHVENMNGGDVKLREDFLEVTDLELRPSEDLENTVLFSCGIKVNGKEYGLLIDNDTRYIVLLKDGTALEYSFLEALDTFYVSNHVGNLPQFKGSADLPQIKIIDVSVDDIDYIKLSGVQVLDSYDITQDRIPGIEFELYRAE